MRRGPLRRLDGIPERALAGWDRLGRGGDARDLRRRAISGAHINPAITLALAARGRFSSRLVVPYVLGQLAGAFVAAAALFVLFGPLLDAKEREKQVTRGQPGSDKRNHGGPTAQLAPVFIGLTVAVLISVIAPLTQACFNPARDFGPRLFAFVAGWGSVAIPGPTPTGFLTVYIAAPVVGAMIGAAIYDLCVRPALPFPSTNVETAEP